MVLLDPVFPEMDCVVVYLPAERFFRQGGQTKLPSTGSSSGLLTLATCGCRPPV